MTEKQDNHLRQLQTEISRILNDKYRAGAVQHGGNLQDLSVSELLDEAINEAIDQLTYLLTAKEKLTNVKNHYGPGMEAGRTAGRDLPVIPKPTVRSLGFLPPNKNLY
jgi:hypothetical protein